MLDHQPPNPERGGWLGGPMVPGWVAVGPVVPAVQPTQKRRSAAWGMPEWFVIGQLIGPAVLFLPGTQPFRVVFRVGVFALGLAGLIVARRPVRYQRHPSEPLLILGLLYTTLMIFHPTTNNFLTGVAQTSLDLAVVAPLFWAPCYFRGDLKRLARVLTILWIFNGASAGVGILQVRDPATWMPKELSSIVTATSNGVAGLTYRSNDGQKVVRPPGLGDAPGAASGAGLLVAVMGLAYLGLPVANLQKALGLAGALLGVTVIFLTHVRSALVMLVGSAVVLLILLMMQRRVGNALVLTGAMAGCGVTAVGYALTLGGQSTIDRFATLIAADPLTVYDRSARMSMVTTAFDMLIFEYPFGAGLGRFGMMRGYFGDEGNIDSPPLWVEVQIPGWVLEGGIPLLTLQVLALVVALTRLARIALKHPSPATRQWAAAVVMLSASPIAFMFSFCPFYAQMGMQFWFLVGAMEGAAQASDAVESSRAAELGLKHDRSTSRPASLLGGGGA